MMKTILIGERLNSSNRKIRELLDEGDLNGIIRVAEAQLEAGAGIIDINCSMLREREREVLFSTGKAVIDKLGARISLDSPDPGVLIEGAGIFGSGCILNSITCKVEELERVGGAAASSGSGIIVMAKDDKGIPSSPEGRTGLVRKAVGSLRKAGIDDESIFLDPVFSPVATDAGGLETALQTLRGMSAEFPDCRRVGGLSNISFGLPDRRLLNRSFLPIALEAGMNAVICDVTDGKLMETMVAAEAITGLDPACRGFLRHYRAKNS